LENTSYTRIANYLERQARQRGYQLLIACSEDQPDNEMRCIEHQKPGNNWQPAQISALVDQVGNYDISVTNLTASSGGCGEENDDAL
ncbi:hypothetical protein ONJ95_24960, partial [Salmonella enterica subsp. enterica serovar Virginia]|nr:hypothetical protein [Salmonella enterica subsp. enterica serovar Virginia]